MLQKLTLHSHHRRSFPGYLSGAHAGGARSHLPNPPPTVLGSRTVSHASSLQHKGEPPGPRYFIIQCHLVSSSSRLFLKFTHPKLSLVFHCQMNNTSIKYYYWFILKKSMHGTSLVVQWLRMHLPMQGTLVWSLVWEDSTCPWATKSENHKWATEPTVANTEACGHRVCSPQEKPPQWEAWAPQRECRRCSMQLWPSTANNK